MTAITAAASPVASATQAVDDRQEDAIGASSVPGIQKGSRKGSNGSDDDQISPFLLAL